MKIGEKVNYFLHRLMIRYAMRAYAKRSKRVEQQHPELFQPVGVEVSRKHRELRGGLALRAVTVG